MCCLNFEDEFLFAVVDVFVDVVMIDVDVTLTELASVCWIALTACMDWFNICVKLVFPTWLQSKTQIYLTCK